ncbi:MAG: protein-glutamate O-methyltransferase CheR [Clostridiales Family XIII bacterium]|jgi:chemotaxis protein methyltransferase CheR|nr:protein-glutamate O-methyltransferase CheR [Clostridiales Family XIII bacterium]
MTSITDAEFREIVSYINDNYGVNLEKKRFLIEGRLGHHLASLGFDSYHEYFEHVKNDATGRELANLLNRLTTRHTFFMREEKHFEFYRSHTLPWIADELGDTDLRVWSAGCSSGQEPYTLSMVTLGYLKERNLRWDSVILATDISEGALAYGSEGVYPAEEVETLPTAWRNEWFERIDDESLRVSRKLRANVAFKKANLLEPFEVRNPFHLIMCRNVMIYFDNDTKSRLVSKFYDALTPGGYLFIGHSESLSSIKNDFDYIKPSIYRKPPVR